MTISVEIITGLDQIAADDWNAIAGQSYPFTRYAFLQALETSGAVGEGSGWQPRHVLVYEHSKLMAVMPTYLKSHSYGEYVFDYAWADAYQRYGLDYYPKLVTAIPFTPVSGPRICIAKGQEQAPIIAAISDYIVSYCEHNALSSWHLLFPSAECARQLAPQLLQRTAVHFQWFNEGYANFDDFLATFSSRKRKNLKKERRQVADQKISLDVFAGSEISEAIWDHFYYFYQRTYAKRSGHGGYLSKDFFQTLARTMPEAIVLVLAKHANQYIAGALNLRDQDTLYGRYWGCLHEFRHLHFETCYYQGIDFCIREGLNRFDPGVQGEHKIQRGFRPVYTYSNHWIVEPAFREAIAGFLQQEKASLQCYHAKACEYLPFKATDADDPSN